MPSPVLTHTDTNPMLTLIEDAHGGHYTLHTQTHRADKKAGGVAAVVPSLSFSAFEIVGERNKWMGTRTWWAHGWRKECRPTTDGTKVFKADNNNNKREREATTHY